MAVPVALSPGASVVAPSTIGSVIFGSVTVISSIVTLPVLVTVNVYSMVFPSADSTPVLAKDSDGSAGTLTTVGTPGSPGVPGRSEEHTYELQSLMRHSYAVFCMKK